MYKVLNQLMEYKRTENVEFLGKMDDLKKNLFNIFTE